MDNSLILTNDECISLVEMTNSKKEVLLYRASRDGFTAMAFHSKCVGKANTVTIIKNTLNYVFGAYSSPIWSGNSGVFIADDNAFIFSLRRKGITESNKFKIKNAEKAFYRNVCYGPAFGGGCDIYICSQSNVHMYSYSNFGDSYDLPDGYKFGSLEAKSYLAGNYNEWLVTEIEVYQIFK